MDTVAYKANRMVMSLNAQDSLPVVTPRAPSRHARWLVNIIGAVDGSFPKRIFPRPEKKDRDDYWKKATSLANKLRGV